MAKVPEWKIDTEQSRIEWAMERLQVAQKLLREKQPNMPSIRSHVDAALVALERISLADLDLELAKFP